MVQKDRKPYGRLQQPAHRHQLDFGVDEEPTCKRGLLFGEFSPPLLFPEHISAFGEQEHGREQLMCLRKVVAAWVPSSCTSHLIATLLSIT